MQLAHARAAATPDPPCIPGSPAPPARPPTRAAPARSHKRRPHAKARTRTRRHHPRSATPARPRRRAPATARPRPCIPRPRAPPSPATLPDHVAPSACRRRQCCPPPPSARAATVGARGPSSPARVGPREAPVLPCLCSRLGRRGIARKQDLSEMTRRSPIILVGVAGLPALHRLATAPLA
ncbi:predicted GPI-anchored protein 58 [Miscanthus floridulus]|uniref:predicted GPI-anchored protein 58 n=1 Tax=Miscanthus floridulus TaxID=154761 RepID=UPI00345A28B1